MKTIKKIRTRALVALSVLALVVTSCVFLDSVDYPDQLMAGEVAEFTMNVHVEAADTATDEKLIIAVLMPTSWDVANNTTVTYTSSLDEGEQTMSVIPESELPANGNGLTWTEHLHNKFGVGPNFNENMQWVAFQSENTYNLVDGDNESAVVKIQTLVGTENLQAQLGFFLNISSDGLSDDEERWKVTYSDCMPVQGGTGDFVDYCSDTAGLNSVAKIASNPYPNPFTNNLNLPLNITSGTDFYISIYDVTGKKVKQYSNASVNSNNVVNLYSELNLSDLTNGLYMISVEANNQKASYKVIKK